MFDTWRPVVVLKLCSINLEAFLEPLLAELQEQAVACGLLMEELVLAFSSIL